MSGKELAVKKIDVREIAARTTLREVRQQGHSYVELRLAGKRHIFFCTLCLTPCFSDSVLFDHLRGSLHARRLAAAKLTLIGPFPPWPFNDGVLFFNNSVERDDHLALPGVGGYSCSVSGDEATSKFKQNGCCIESNHNGAIVPCENGNSAVSYKHGRNGYNGTHDNCLVRVSSGPRNGLGCICSYLGMIGVNSALTIPRILINDDVIDLRVQLVGIGQIGSKNFEMDGNGSKISRIWCTWLGDGDLDDNTSTPALPRCDFAILTFSYTCDLGRKVGIEDTSTLILPGSLLENDMDSPRKRRKNSCYEHEDPASRMTDQCASNGEDCSEMSVSSANGSHEIESLGILSGKDLRRELRRRKRLAAEKICDICSQPMLPGKDVATLLNLKTTNLACSSRNTNGAFHLFHASCLIHWILFCVSETWSDQSANKKTTRRRRGRASKKKPISRQITSIFCPECQGTGMHIQGDELESPCISLSEMFLLKLKVIEAHKAWMKGPEDLQKCSTGLHLLSAPAENSQTKMIPLKLLSIYQAGE